MTPEQLADFNRFFYANNGGGLIDIYNEWAETQDLGPKEVAVGLTKEQVIDLSSNLDSWNIGDADGFELHISNWLKTRTFAVREVAVGLTDEQIEWLQIELKLEGGWWHKKIQDWLKSQTFTLPEVCVKFSDKQLWDLYDDEEVKEIAVGLTDEQVESYIKYWSTCNSLVGLDAYKEWAKTQTFAQQPQFTPDWEESSAKYFQIRECWLDESGNVISWHLREELERPTPPTPKVEVGQTWKYKGKHYTIGLFSKLKEGSEWVDCVNYISDDGNCYTRTLENFLAKFERVQP